MEKIIYADESSKLVANADGGVVVLKQFIDGELIGSVSMFFEEVAELNDFVNGEDGNCEEPPYAITNVHPISKDEAAAMRDDILTYGDGLHPAQEGDSE